MWQQENSTPAYIYGLLNTTNVDKTKVLLSESIILSRSTCSVSTDLNITMPPREATPAEDLEVNLLEVRFNSTALLAYKKAILRVNMVFVDIAHNMVASLVSVTQGETTLVMKTPIPNFEWTMTDGDSNTGLIEGKPGKKTTETPVTQESSSSTTEPLPLPAAVE